MANNHGGSGSKFVSVNLNKLYGQASHHSYQSHSGSYGPGVGSNRARTGGPGGGMVVLSRNRPLQKAMPKLSVPPPLNLPSLRKEYEKTDSSGAGGGVAGGAGSGSGSRPTSSGMSWSKPGNIALKEDTQVSENTKGNGAYLPPSARFGGHGDTVSSAHHSNVEKAMVLRGEDFPSLRAVLPSSTGPTAQKHKEVSGSGYGSVSGSSQKVKHLVSEESSTNDLRNTSHFNSPAHIQSSHRMPNRVNENPRPNLARLDHALKQDDPLSLIQLNPRSDWADDERDTGRRFVGRTDQELPKTETYWDRDFDVPVLPHKPPNNLSERHGAKGSTSEALKAEPYREVDSWRKSSIHKDRSSTHFGVVTENKETAYVRRQWNLSVESPRNRNEGFQKGSKSVFSKGEQTFADNSYQKDFSSSVYDEGDPLTGSLVGLLKRKKAVNEHTDFHDPVRESFEAELERVQKMQEMERQRIVDEQERALEQARREDEERRRVVLEEEERRRRMEEEAKEAAWRAEQERLDAIQKAEELKIAREGEKRRMFLEEERRKQAAKQKLLDLEARMAKRNAEAGKTGDTSMDLDLDNWEVSQRMVERITTSTSSDSSAMERPPFDQTHSMERGKPINPWKKEAFEVGSNSSFLLNDHENGHHSPSREAPVGGRSLHRKEYYGVGGYTDGYSHLGDRDHRWNSFGDGDAFGRNRETESEFYDNVGPKYDEVGWGQGHSRNNTHFYPDRFESDKPYSYGRSRYSMKQPRVLPPPLLSSAPRSSVRGENELSAPSSSLESTARTGNYVGPQDNLQQEIMTQNNVTLRCDSQSSLSVSSPPSSPTHLSHDELDDEQQKEVNDEPGEVTTMPGLDSVSKDEDEDEEWNLENHDELQEQEEYDEDDGYGEEDEVLEVPDDLTQEFEHLQIEEKSTTDELENLVLGFNEGVEVEIPGDEFEKDLKTDGNTVDVPEASVTALEKQAAVDAVIHEHENAYISTCSTPPVQLQFGLFSRPAFIPSPVPAIQIGSIQMPLLLHHPPPVASTLGHSQPPPLFQFGQLLYSSPVSHGMTQQPVSLDFQPTHTHFNLDQNQLSQETSAPIMKKDTGFPTQTEEKSHGTTNNDSHLQFAPTSSRVLSAEKNVPLLKAPGPPNRGKRTVYPPRNSGPRSFQAYEPVGSNDFPRKHRRPIQRTEFRVRENANSAGLDDKLNNKTPTRSGYRRQTGPATSLKRVVPETGMISENRPGKETARTKTQTASSSVESSNLSRNIPEDVDAPLQSGVVRVFEQPGVECQSDEDDFIEVRSKRQMLNDRREQREKEIKAKSRATKQPRKAHVISSGHKNKTSATLVGEMSNNIRSDVGIMRKEQTVEQTSADTDLQTGIRLHTSKPSEIVSALSVAEEDNGSKHMFETENKVVDDAQTSLGGWDDVRSDQQVIPLTQIQLDEAMKPSMFNTTHITSIGDQTTLDNEPIFPKGKSVPSSSTPINSLLAGEKIQFGAVTSPTMLPPSSCVVSHAVGSFGSDMTQNISKPENDYKRSKDNCEAKVEAVAVSAIDTDKIVGTKSFGGGAEAVQGGLDVDQQSGSQTKAEDSLSVSLPADLSVETPPMCLWPPLPSPQPSSIPHFPPPTPSHFPFYDINHPIMSGPVFALGRHDESSGAQSQAQKPTDSRHVGPWQNHSGMDPFYGPPAGFTGPFIGPPGGVQPSPHMVVYNHYSPVGQFGQVGLSFMGATYIPSGKQPDWKHDPTSSSGRSDEDMRPRNQPNNNMQTTHLAPGSPLLSMTMFDAPPFQAAPDMSVQARWSHVPASSLHAVPISAEVVTGPSQFSSHGGHPVDQSTFRISEPQASSPSVVVRDSNITHFQDELGLLDSSASPAVTGSHISSGPTKTGDGGAGINNVEFKNQQHGKNLSSSQQYNNNNHHHHHGGGGYGYQRVSPKNKPMGGQWSHRRSGFHGRYQSSMGAEKSFPSSTKVKQIYVAKQPTASSGSSF